MAPVDEYCKVTAQGIAHLFVDLDYGRVCVCGRKAYVFAVEDEQPVLRDRPPATITSPLVASARLKNRVTDLTWRTDLLLACGEAEIHRARRARDDARATRPRRSFARAEALLLQGQFVLRSARQACRLSVTARALRAPRTSGPFRDLAGAAPGRLQRRRPEPEERWCSRSATAPASSTPISISLASTDSSQP